MNRKIINASIAYIKAYSILEKLSKYDEEKDERVVSMYTAVLEMTKLLEQIKSLEDKVNNQRYHIKKLEHRNDVIRNACIERIPRIKGYPNVRVAK